MENIILYEYNGKIKGTKAHIKINLFDDTILNEKLIAKVLLISMLSNLALYNMARNNTKDELLPFNVPTPYEITLDENGEELDNENNLEEKGVSRKRLYKKASDRHI